MDHLENLEEFSIPEEAIEKLKNPLYLQQSIAQNIPLQKILSFSEDTMQKFYNYAKYQFQKEEYELATEGFIFLTTLNPFIHEYWMGLGMSEELSQEYHGAIMAYDMAIRTDCENPLPHYHLANCHRNLHDNEKAKEAIVKTLELCTSKHESLKGLAKKFLSSFSNSF